LSVCGERRIIGATNASPTGTATFLFMDIEGSTRLVRALGGTIVARTLIGPGVTGGGADRGGIAFFGASGQSGSAALPPRLPPRATGWRSRSADWYMVSNQ